MTNNAKVVNMTVIEEEKELDNSKENIQSIDYKGLNQHQYIKKPKKVLLLKEIKL